MSTRHQIRFNRGPYAPKDGYSPRALLVGGKMAFVGGPTALRKFIVGLEKQAEHTGAVKTLADMSPEERAAIEARYGAKIK